MNITGGELVSWLSALMWPFMRISAMFVAAPIFSARSVPVRIRVLLAFFIAWILMPVIPTPPVVDLISGEALVISVSQIIIGVAMGFILQMVFSAFIIGGQSIATAMGLFAAIPAVVAYNKYADAVQRLESRYEDFAEEFANILQRQAHMLLGKK